MTFARLSTLSIIALFSSSPAFATDGYFALSYSVKSQGMGGVGIALPQDGLAAATNPAGSAFVEDRADVGLTWFSPDRHATITGNGAGADGTYSGNGKRNFYIPELGYVRQVSPSTTVGLAIYANGGMNTEYNDNPYAAFGSTGKAGVNLEQLFISPSLAYRLNEHHAVGIALNFAYQKFSAQGLGAFAQTGAQQVSVAPDNVTNQGNDSSTGWGVRLGWTGQITPELTLGAAWTSKTNMGNFDKYRGLFAGNGGFDIPESYGLGLAYKLTPVWTVAADVTEIKYSDIDSVANPLSNLTVQGNPLGSANGPGFGWRDVTVYKLGVSYDYSPDLTLRAGYNHSGQPIPADQTFFNILAPGVVQDHLTVGATWKVFGNGELSLAYAHVFEETVNGSNSIPANFGGGNANLTMSEDSLGVAYGWKFQL
ncbi:MAG: outer membrane protein transport protein [Gallionellaceae bacterium]|jgi:long-chain fatty acid transport protein|nr:outer membrane protein transport protein [Gallionellaceae bacterium]